MVTTEPMETMVQLVRRVLQVQTVIMEPMVTMVQTEATVLLDQQVLLVQTVMMELPDQQGPQEQME